MMNRKLFISVVGSIFALILIMTGLFLYVQHPLTAKITLEVSPATSNITVNGVDRKSGEIKVRPGNYKIICTHDGFETVTQSIVVKNGDNPYVGIVLVSNSTSTANWYASHSSDEQLAETITGKNSDLVSAIITKKLPLVSSLPFIDLNYRIDYGQSKQHPNDSSAVALYIKYYTPEAKQQALEWIKFKGYDPTKLEIIYQDTTDKSSKE